MSELIVNMGNSLECVLSTCLIEKISTLNSCKVDVLASTYENSEIFRFNKHVNKSYTLADIVKLKENVYNNIYCLSNGFVENLGIKYQKIIGFNKNQNNICADILYGTRKTHKNIYEVYFDIIGEKWRGEGPYIRYYPKKRVFKDRSGMFVLDLNLRNYITHELKLEKSKMWEIPNRKNIFSKMDEINTCSNVVTDDFLVLQLSMILKKKIVFLKNVNYNFNLEIFKMGKIIPIPKNIITLGV